MKSIYWLNELSYTSNYLKTSTLKKNRLSQLILAISAKEEKNVMPILHQMHAQNEAMTLCKDLANAPGNLCTPTYLAHQAKALAKKYKTLSVSVMDEKELKKEGMGLILAVSQGTKQPPQLITLQHNGSPKKMKPIVLIGKGVTFDTGGINLKTGAGMDEMRYDMCGAATVFAIMQAAAEMKWPINLIGVAVAVENFPAYEAVKPGDIVKSLSGKTVEILNTDAEGRLILADALTYVSRFQPRFVFDIATLTSSIVNALGGYGCGIFSEDDELAHALCHAGDATGDRAWRMPMWAECDDELKTPFADLSNISFTNSAYARSIVAARFLAQFAKNYRWAHIDIAGIAWRSGRQKGATGRPIPLLMNFFCEQLKKL
jgi:leucyl aminopeptidase